MLVGGEDAISGEKASILSHPKPGSESTMALQVVARQEDHHLDRSTSGRVASGRIGTCQRPSRETIGC
jgi:hypothetical protein